MKRKRQTVVAAQPGYFVLALTYSGEGLETIHSCVQYPVIAWRLTWSEYDDEDNENDSEVYADPISIETIEDPDLYGLAIHLPDDRVVVAGMETYPDIRAWFADMKKTVPERRARRLKLLEGLRAKDEGKPK